MKRGLVLFNPKSGVHPAGDGVNPTEISRLLALHNIEATIESSADQFTARIREAVAQGIEIVVAAGGDGTLGTVANALVGSTTALGVLPVGTYNHFARDLGIPLNLEQAVRIIASGHSRQIDVGEVNGRVFVNNSSIGAYPEMVLDRELQRRARGRGKTGAMLWATLRVFVRFRLVELKLSHAGTVQRTITPLIFIGNNCYRFDFLAPRRRPALDRGELSVHTINCCTRWEMLCWGLRAALGRLTNETEGEPHLVNECWIDSKKRHLSIAVDGEILKLAPPLHYRSRPGALRVIVPEENTSG